MGVLNAREHDQNSPQPPAEFKQASRYECRPDYLYESDVPPGWKDDKTPMCAVTWPSQTPFTEISECCTGPVQVFHACFHYCATDLRSHSFLECARKHMDAKHIGVPCNAAVWPNREETTGPAKTTGLMNGPSVFLLSAVIVILMACAGTQYISTSASARRQIQSCLGMFLCFLFVMALIARVFSVEREGEG